MLKKKNCTLLSEWFSQIIEILVGISANGRLPRYSTEEDHAHFREVEKGIEVHFFYYTNNVIKQLQNLVVCIFLSSLKGSISMYKINIVK